MLGVRTRGGQRPIHTYIHKYIHTYVRIHAYMHTCMHAYIHTYIHTYLHTYIPVWKPRGQNPTRSTHISNARQPILKSRFALAVSGVNTEFRQFVVNPRIFPAWAIYKASKCVECGGGQATKQFNCCHKQMVRNDSQVYLRIFSLVVVGQLVHLVCPCCTICRDSHFHTGICLPLENS